jgi:nicotinamidase-related amidase
VNSRRHPNTLDPSRTALIIVDMQDAFRASIFEFDKILSRIKIMAEAATLLKIPTLVTEQVPSKLGPTVSELLPLLPPNTKPIPKTAFSCCGSPEFLSQLADTKATQTIVCGIEAHVCLNQTVHDLLAHDYQVHVLSDAISSRTEQNRQIGLAKITQSGAIPCSTEMALFELMQDATHEQFRAIQKLIR